ncbi:MAG: hypothetical protein WCS42_25180 [Verrucomicrobiota bacterium]
MSKNFNTTDTISIPADGSPVSRDITFRYFMVRTAKADFEMSFDGQSWFPMAQGEAIGPFEPAETKVWFRAIAGAVDVEFRASSVANSNNRLNIIKDISQSSLYLKEPPTFAIGGNSDMANGTTAAIAGDYDGKQRRSLKIYNLSAAGQLTIQDADGNTCGAIPPGGNDEFLTSDTVKIRNDSGAVLSVAWMEIYYAN